MLGFNHGDDFWDPQHGQKLAVGSLVAAIGHIVNDFHPIYFVEMRNIIRTVHPGSAPRALFRSRLLVTFSAFDCNTALACMFICADWYLGEPKMPKSWSIDQGHEFLQEPHVLPAYIALLRPLFPAVDVPTPAGDLRIGLTPFHEVIIKN